MMIPDDSNQILVFLELFAIVILEMDRGLFRRLNDSLLVSLPWGCLTHFHFSSEKFESVPRRLSIRLKSVYEWTDYQKYKIIVHVQRQSSYVALGNWVFLSLETSY